MAKILYACTHGSDDPTMAAMAFVMAKGAVEASHQATIALIGEGVWLMKDMVAENVKGVGWPTVKELLIDALRASIPIYV